MSKSLSGLERRVLGVLLEKKLSQPQYYPLTLNAVVAASNQKSNRDPHMHVDEATAYDTLEDLREKELASRVLPGGGSRTDRFRTDAAQTFGWSAAEQAVMAELLLRGPQTVGELRTRCGRMHGFESTDQVAETLKNLGEREEPFVVLLPRAAGQSAVRYRHTLYEPDEVNAFEAAPAAAPAAPRSAPRSDEDLAALRDEVAALRQRIESLEQKLQS